MAIPVVTETPDGYATVFVQNQEQVTAQRANEKAMLVAACQARGIAVDDAATVDAYTLAGRIKNDGRPPRPANAPLAPLKLR